MWSQVLCPLRSRVYKKQDWEVLDDHDWFKYNYEVEAIIKNQGSKKMSRRLPDGSKERFAGGDIQAVYIDVFADRKMTRGCAKALVERFYRRGEDYFGILLLKEQESVLVGASLIRSTGDSPDASIADDVVGSVLGVCDDWDREGAVGGDEVDKNTIKHPFTFKDLVAPTSEGSRRTRQK